MDEETKAALTTIEAELAMEPLNLGRTTGALVAVIRLLMKDESNARQDDNTTR